jgi:hypothetical protein
VSLNERLCLCGCGSVLSDNTHRRDARFATPACGRRYRQEQKQAEAGLPRDYRLVRCSLPGSTLTVESQPGRQLKIASERGRLVRPSEAHWLCLVLPFSVEHAERLAA